MKCQAVVCHDPIYNPKKQKKMNDITLEAISKRLEAPRRL